MVVGNRSWFQGDAEATLEHGWSKVGVALRDTCPVSEKLGCGAAVAQLWQVAQGSGVGQLRSLGFNAQLHSNLWATWTR